MPHFKIQQTESGLWFYQFISPEGSVLLTGTKHDFKQSCLGEILSVKMNSIYIDNYEKRFSPSKDQFFLLRSMGSEKIIGISELFCHSEGWEKTIKQIKKWVETAIVK